MSTLISRLGRRFREKKVKSTSNLDLPPLPNPREILEDIENCQNGDPIIGLATVIQKKGRQSSLLDKDFFLEDPSISMDSSISDLAFLAPYQVQSPAAGGAGSGVGGPSRSGSFIFGDGGGGGTTSGGEESSGQQGHGQGHHKRRSSLTLMTGAGSKNKGNLDGEYLNSYNKLKQFLLLFEKSEEILEALEPQFRRVENQMRERNKEITAENDDGGGGGGASFKMEVEGDVEEPEQDYRKRQLSESSDICSSPLL